MLAPSLASETCCILASNAGLWDTTAVSIRFDKFNMFSDVWWLERLTRHARGLIFTLFVMRGKISETDLVQGSSLCLLILRVMPDLQFLSLLF